MLDTATAPGVAGVCYIACSQGGGKTEILLNVVGYYVDHDPSPILIVEPNLEMADALSKDRFAPMIRATGLAIREPRSRSSGNTIRHKMFRGGHATLVGSNSAAGLSMRPIRVLVGDEFDRWSASAGTEGDPWKIAEMRTSAFWNAVKLVVTSPVFKGNPDGSGGSRSWSLWMSTDRREYFVPCYRCDKPQWLKWEQVHWDKDEAGNHLPETAVYVCEFCGEAWEDRQRWAAIRQADLRRSEGYGYQATTKSTSGWIGFRLPAMSVIGRELEPMVRQWLDAQGFPERIKVFKNTVLAEWYEEQFHALDETGLLSRREQLVEVNGVPEIPAPCAVLTAGVDVQEAPPRFEIDTWAWASGRESWVLEHHVIYGDPSGNDVWRALDDYLMRKWPRAAGGFDWIRAVCIDTGGHHTQRAYDFCAPRFRRQTEDGGRQFVFATKGFAGSGEIWPRGPSKTTKKVPLWPLRVDPGKENLYGRLGISDPGPGYIHLSNSLDARWCKGLVSEKVVDVTDRKGRTKRVWMPKSERVRNEALDCAVMALAALLGLEALGFDLELECERLAKRPIFTVEEGLVAAKSIAAPETPPQVAPVRQKPRPRAPGWLGNTRGWLR